MPCSWRCPRGKDAEVMPLAVCCQTLVLCRLLWECCKGARWFCSWAKRWKRGPMAAAGSWKSYFHTGQGIFSPNTTTDISAQTLDKDDDGVSCTAYTHTLGFLYANLQICKELRRRHPYSPVLAAFTSWFSPEAEEGQKNEGKRGR